MALSMYDNDAGGYEEREREKEILVETCQEK